MSEQVTYERLHEVLYYNKLTGIFIWLVAIPSKIKVGDIAGSIDTKGYRIIKIDGKVYKAHRLAWLYENGYFPEHGLDHRDRIPDHNWILNLREASKQCNARNTGNSKNNTSGVKGVCWSKNENKWKVQITIDKKKANIGTYIHLDNAACARLAAEQCVGWEGCDSCSPAFQYVQLMLKTNKKTED